MSEIKDCHSLGPFNSGTVLMGCYLQQLFRNFAPKRLNCWKHSLPPDYYRDDSPQNSIEVTDQQVDRFKIGILFKERYCFIGISGHKTYSTIQWMMRGYSPNLWLFWILAVKTTGQNVKNILSWCSICQTPTKIESYEQALSRGCQ